LFTCDGIVLLHHLRNIQIHYKYLYQRDEETIEYLTNP